jgi:hypothetical protein
MTEKRARDLSTTPDGAIAYSLQFDPRQEAGSDSRKNSRIT